LIERWLGLVAGAAKRDTGLALEVAACAGLVKGYGETHRRGKGNFLALMDALVDNPPMTDPQGQTDPKAQAQAIRKAREAALADPEGKALGGALGKPVTWLKAVKG
jgi:indolepyruvate ferredoxin oxidoreductase beta subunit